MFTHGSPLSVIWVSAKSSIPFFFIYYFQDLNLMIRLILLLFAVKNQKKLWVLVYVIACATSLIPAPLIEFRYYTIPFFFMILHTNITDNISWLLLGALYLSINCFTMYTFLYRPFSWAHEAGTQRFIW